MFFFLDDSLPITMKFSFPDPMIIDVGKPFHVIGGAIVKETFPLKFKIKHKMERKFLGKWLTLPCVGENFNGENPFVEYENFNGENPFVEYENIDEKPW